jgi:hypothetical protein
VCCNVIQAEQIMSNLVGAQVLSSGQTISFSEIKEYCRGMSRLIPGYVYFDVAPDRISRAVNSCFSKSLCVSQEGEDLHIRFLADSDDIITPSFNSSLSESQHDLVDSYTKYFLSKKTAG